MDYFDLLEEVVRIKYNCLSSTGRRPVKILVPSQLAKISGIEDMVEVLGIRIEIIQSNEEALKVQLEQ